MFFKAGILCRWCFLLRLFSWFSARFGARMLRAHEKTSLGNDQHPAANSNNKDKNDGNGKTVTTTTTTTTRKITSQQPQRVCAALNEAYGSSNAPSSQRRKHKYTQITYPKSSTCVHVPPLFPLLLQLSAAACGLIHPWFSPLLARATALVSHVCRKMTLQLLCKFLGILFFQETSFCMDTACCKNESRLLTWLMTSQCWTLSQEYCTTTRAEQHRTEVKAEGH